MKKCFILLLSLFLSGCATFPDYQPQSKKYDDFFGVRINKIADSKNFIINKYDGVNVSYTKGNGIDSTIYAWGTLILSYGTFLRINVTNKSNNPISTNYFSDSFELLTNDGKRYQLSKEDISYYPRNGVINPDSHASFRVQMPSNLKKEDIALILCSLGVVNKTNIILKPLPIPTQAENVQNVEK